MAREGAACFLSAVLLLISLVSALACTRVFGIVPVPAYYVSPTGSDSAAGTLLAPFATLAQAQTAMRAGSIKTTYIRGGTYAPASVAACDGSHPCAVNLSAADNGETWSYYPPDGVDSASITGGSTNGSNGLFYIFWLGNVANPTINGLAMHNFGYGAIASVGGTTALTANNNLIFNGYYVPGSNDNAAGIQCYGCTNTTITHNTIHDIASFGISFNNVNGNISNLNITNNVLYNICTGLADCGAIYVQDTFASATNMQVTNNYIHDGNTFAGLGSGFGSGMYNDDCTSNITETGNVLTGRNGANTVHMHGGNNIHFVDNIIDLATLGQSSAFFQTSSLSGCAAGTMSGNTFTNNILTSNGNAGGYTKDGSPTNAPTITHNSYWNYAGSGGLPAYAHIVFVVEENHHYSQIIGSNSAPYINSLASGGVLFTNSFAVTHPSEPNYFALFVGSTKGVTDDNDYNFSGPSFAGQMATAGKSFKGYIDSGSPRKHNPWESFSDSLTVEAAFSTFPTDFTTLPAVSWVIPNLNNDMHDGTILQGDQWLQANIGAYATWAATHNSLLIVTWDEDDETGNNNQVATIFYGANLHSGQY